jgi:hypothetical protein
MHNLSRALAAARTEDLHREVARMQMIRLARGSAHEGHTTVTGVAKFGGRMWSGRRDGRLRRGRAPMHREMGSERS